MQKTSNSQAPGGLFSDSRWEEIRARFPTLERRTYLNSCAYGAISTDVAKALRQYVNDRVEKGSDWDYWVQKNESVRGAVAQLLGADPDEIAITSSASAGINSVASALNFDRPRNKVVISDFEFPTNGQIWYAQEMRGAKVVRVAANDGYIPVENFEQAIDEETLIVAVTHVCYRNGAKLDIPAIAELARRNGALMLMDGYQGLGTIAIDAASSGADFIVGGMVKYLLGTAGIGFLYARGELIPDLTPTVTGWFAQADINAMDATRYDPAPTARRFEAGAPPVPNSYAAEAGLSIIREIGLPAIEARIGELTDAVRDAAREAGYSIATPADPAHHGPMVAIRAHDDAALVAKLGEAGIVTSCRGGNLRVALHFYNNASDIESLFTALKRNEHLLV